MLNVFKKVTRYNSIVNKNGQIKIPNELIMYHNTSVLIKRADNTLVLKTNDFKIDKAKKILH